MIADAVYGTGWAYTAIENYISTRVCRGLYLGQW